MSAAIEFSGRMTQWIVDIPQIPTQGSWAAASGRSTGTKNYQFGDFTKALFKGTVGGSGRPIVAKLQIWSRVGQNRFCLRAEQLVPMPKEPGYHSFVASQDLPIVQPGWLLGFSYAESTGGFIAFDGQGDPCELPPHVKSLHGRNCSKFCAYSTNVEHANVMVGTEVTFQGKHAGGWQREYSLAAKIVPAEANQRFHVQLRFSQEMGAQVLTVNPLVALSNYLDRPVRAKVIVHSAVGIADSLELGILLPNMTTSMPMRVEDATLELELSCSWNGVHYEGREALLSVCVSAAPRLLPMTCGRPGVAPFYVLYGYTPWAAVTSADVAVNGRLWLRPVVSLESALSNSVLSFGLGTEFGTLVGGGRYICGDQSVVKSESQSVVLRLGFDGEQLALISLLKAHKQTTTFPLRRNGAVVNLRAQVDIVSSSVVITVFSEFVLVNETKLALQYRLRETDPEQDLPAGAVADIGGNLDRQVREERRGKACDDADEVRGDWLRPALLHQGACMNEKCFSLDVLREGEDLVASFSGISCRLRAANARSHLFRCRHWLGCSGAFANQPQLMRKVSCALRCLAPAGRRP
jgi:hypothetical protein